MAYIEAIRPGMYAQDMLVESGLMLITKVSKDRGVVYARVWMDNEDRFSDDEVALGPQEMELVYLENADVSALCGKLSPEEYSDRGMQLFQKGIVNINPLGVGPRAFPLSVFGTRLAKAMRVQ